MRPALAEGLLAGDFRALARAITLVENQQAGGADLQREIYAHVGRAHRVGITGPPGAGKSSLVSALIRQIRARGEKVGVIAVDPSSPFSGGALLGDRVRMQSVALDPGVFIRSMASRGSLGGLARRTAEVADLVDAAGVDWVLIETVGVGQTEIEIVEVADTTVLVLSPESGDGVQAMKAGLMEIADIYAVNKFDRPGAEKMLKAVQAMQELATGEAARPIVPTEAISGKGVDELWNRVVARRAEIEGNGQLEAGRAARTQVRLRHALREAIEDRLFGPGGLVKLEALAERVARGLPPQQVAEEALSQLVAESAA